jgi:hypothetical protein
VAEGRPPVRAPGPRPVSRSRAYGLGTGAYVTDFNEVKALASTTSDVRTPDQTAAAQYWA